VLVGAEFADERALQLGRLSAQFSTREVGQGARVGVARDQSGEDFASRGAHHVAGQDRLRMSACYGVSLHCSVMHTPRSVDVDRLQAASYERIDGAALAVEEMRLRRRLQRIPETAPSSFLLSPATRPGCAQIPHQWSIPFVFNFSTSMWTLIEKATNTEPEAGATHAFVIDAAYCSRPVSAYDAMFAAVCSINMSL
jgi:hypothetical protein